MRTGCVVGFQDVELLSASNVVPYQSRAQPERPSGLSIQVSGEDSFQGI